AIKYITPYMFMHLIQDQSGDPDTWDWTPAINAADSVAAFRGEPLVFPAGTYRGYGMTPTTSWLALGPRGSAVIQNNNRISNIYDFCKCVSQSSLSFTNLVFDGWVTEDPLTWNSSTFNAFQGAIAFWAVDCSGLVFTNCLF